MNNPFRKPLSTVGQIERDIADGHARKQAILESQPANGELSETDIAEYGRLEAREKLLEASLVKAQEAERIAADEAAEAQRQRDIAAEKARRKSAYDAIRAQGRRAVKAAESIEEKVGGLADDLGTYHDALDKIYALLPDGIDWRVRFGDGDEELSPLWNGADRVDRITRATVIAREFARAADRRNIPLKNFPGADADDPTKLAPLTRTVGQMMTAVVALGKSQLIDPPKPPLPDYHCTERFIQRYEPAHWEAVRGERGVGPSWRVEANGEARPPTPAEIEGDLKYGPYYGRTWVEACGEPGIERSGRYTEYHDDDGHVIARFADHAAIDAWDKAGRPVLIQPPTSGDVEPVAEQPVRRMPEVVSDERHAAACAKLPRLPASVQDRLRDLPYHRLITAIEQEPLGDEHTQATTATDTDGSLAILG